MASNNSWCSAAIASPAWIRPTAARCGRIRIKTDWGLNISTPVWSPADHLLLFSSAYGTGSRALELRQASGKTTVAERWAVNRVRVHIGTIIRLGDTAYMSSGDFGPAFLTAVNTKTGAIAWQDRTFARAQLLHADGKLIVLDEDGTLGDHHRVAARPQGPGARADPREPRLDAADAGRQDPLRARSQDHCGVRPQLSNLG